MGKMQFVEQRLDKLEIALVMLLNALRGSKKLGDDAFIVQLPGDLLNYLETIILSRPQKD